MMLTDARDFVRSQGVTSLQEVATHLGVATDIAEALLQKWLDKGRIEQLPSIPRCGGCDRCSPAVQMLYRWRTQDAPGPNQPEPGRSISVPNACPEDGPPQDQTCDSPASQSSS